MSNPPIPVQSLKPRRKANGFKTQASVAAFVGKSITVIRRLEQEAVLPHGDAGLWVRLQSVYGLTIEEFCLLTR